MIEVKNGVKVFIKKENSDKFLFQLRDNRPDIPHPNMWSLFGGGIEENETALEALQREILEELNIELSNIQKLDEINHNIILENHQKQILIQIYQASTNNNITQTLEGQKFDWFTLSEALNSNLVPELKELIIKHQNSLQK